MPRPVGVAGAGRDALRTARIHVGGDGATGVDPDSPVLSAVQGGHLVVDQRYDHLTVGYATAGLEPRQLREGLRGGGGVGGLQVTAVAIEGGGPTGTERPRRRRLHSPVGSGCVGIARQVGEGGCFLAWQGRSGARRRGGRGVLKTPVVAGAVGRHRRRVGGVAGFAVERRDLGAGQGGRDDGDAGQRPVEVGRPRPVEGRGVRPSGQLASADRPPAVVVLGARSGGVGRLLGADQVQRQRSGRVRHGGEVPGPVVDRRRPDRLLQV